MLEDESDFFINYLCDLSSRWVKRESWLKEIVYGVKKIN